MKQPVIDRSAEWEDYKKQKHANWLIINELKAKVKSWERGIKHLETQRKFVHHDHWTAWLVLKELQRIRHVNSEIEIREDLCNRAYKQMAILDGLSFDPLPMTASQRWEAWGIGRNPYVSTT